MAARNKTGIHPILIPENYIEYDENQRNEFCYDLIDNMLHTLDKQLPDAINRIDFLTDVLLSSEKGAVDTENYEAAAIIRDILKRLNE